MKRNFFHTKIFSRLVERGKNIAISPYSIAAAFELLKIASYGETRKEIEELFGDFKSIEIPEDFNLRISNSVWTVDQISSEYLNKVKESLGSEAHNFPEGDGKPINNWVSEKTKNLIPKIVPENLDMECRSVLVNAIYFLANWVYKFDKNETLEDGDFTLENGAKVKAPMMRSFNKTARYFENKETQFVVLPYMCHDNNPKSYIPRNQKKFMPSMILALPRRGEDFIDFISNWNPLEHVSMSFEKEYSILSFPRFDLSWGSDIKEFLMDIGIVKACSNNSEATGILNSGEPLKVDGVQHESVIKVNEEGTEAAAATAIKMFRCCALSEPEIPEKKFSFVANRPFAFSIVEEISNNVLFMGTVFDPTKKR